MTGQDRATAARSDRAKSSAPKWQVDDEDMADLCAFVLVMNRAPANEVNMLAIWALPLFSGRACVDCVSCTSAGSWADLPLMTVTAAAAHHRDHPTHKLRLALDRFQVIT